VVEVREWEWCRRLISVEKHGRRYSFQDHEEDTPIQFNQINAYYILRPYTLILQGEKSYMYTMLQR